MPSVDEWYKAAYYDPTSSVYYNFSTGSDSLPTPVPSGTAAGTAVFLNQGTPANITLAGGLSAYGTMGQGGNVYEWEETDLDLVNNSTARAYRGGTWNSGGERLWSLSSRFSVNPAEGDDNLGFRVASTIPEPNSGIVFVGSLLATAMRRRRIHQAVSFGWNVHRCCMAVVRRASVRCRVKSLNERNPCR